LFAPAAHVTEAIIEIRVQVPKLIAQRCCLAACKIWAKCCPGAKLNRENEDFQSSQVPIQTQASWFKPALETLCFKAEWSSLNRNAN
jgi:hypothetical protein